MIQKFPKKRTPAALLGLTFDGNRLEGAVVRRSNGSLRVTQTFSATLALNPLNADPALVGREIRNCLEHAGIREKNCVVCIPLGWALAVQTRVPRMPDEDLASFLEIEAERGFPYGPETLSISNSICQNIGEGERLATLVAVQKNHLLQFERAIRAAQLRPLSFTLGVAALRAAEADLQRGALTLAVGENSLDLQITLNGGVAILRSLESAIEVEGAQKTIDAEALAREIRVTLGQLPMEVRGAIRNAILFGNSELAQKLAHNLAAGLQAMRISIDWQRTYPADAFRSQFPANTNIAPHLSAAARHLTGERVPFEYLPPKVSAWQQLTARVSSKKLGWAGVAAAFLFIAAGSSLGAQQWKLSQLRRQWAGMEGKVKAASELQDNIRKYRPWFDESLPSMNILRRVTESFPVAGQVWTKSLEIREQSQVTCTGTARTEDAFTNVMSQLRASSEVSNLSLDSAQGAPQIQFTFKFQWNPGGRNEN